MAEPRLQQLADSAALKLLQFVVTGVMVPCAFWFGGKLIDWMHKVDTILATQVTQTATFELRMQAQERAAGELRASVNLLNEKAVRQEYELRRLDERSKQ